MSRNRKEPCIVCGKLVVVYGSEPKICFNHWKCPKCGGSPEIDVHSQVRCTVCEGVWSSSDFCKVVLKKNHRVKCPYCKGAGTVATSKEIGVWDEST